MIWPFRRKPKQLQRPPINEDWRPGDLAYCLNGDWSPSGGPAKGEICRVADVFPGFNSVTNEPGWGLRLEGWKPAYAATSFRKVHPDRQQASSEFSDYIKRVIRKARKVEAKA